MLITELSAYHQRIHMLFLLFIKICKFFKYFVEVYFLKSYVFIFCNILVFKKEEMCFEMWAGLGYMQVVA